MHQLRLLNNGGAREVVICVGYLGHQIVDRLGDEHMGISLTYSFDAPGLSGTLGAIRRAAGLLGDRFLVLYGDAYLRVDYREAVAAWKGSTLPAMMTVFRNEGRLAQSNAVFDGFRVTAYDKTAPSPDKRWIDYGLGALDARTLNLIPSADLADLYAELAQRRELFGFPVAERFYEIGTPAALVETEAYLRNVTADS
jgi:NDP-sugar pyrophosphorylase family protein